MELHFIFLWFGQIFGQFLSLKTSSAFSAFVLTLDGVHTFHPWGGVMFLPDLFWHEVIFLDSDILIAQIYCLFCSCNDTHKKNQPKNQQAQKAVNICFFSGCLSCQMYPFQFMILRKRAFIVY